MGGVDLFNQSFTYYHYPHRFAKWWRFLFAYLLEISINIFFIVFLKLNHDAAKDHYNFGFVLSKSLYNFEIILVEVGVGVHRDFNYKISIICKTKS